MDSTELHNNMNLVSTNQLDVQLFRTQSERFSHYIIYVNTNLKHLQKLMKRHLYSDINKV